MQTQAELKVGSLVVWHGGSYPGNDEDVDDVGIVTSVEREWHNDVIVIFWSVINKTNHFSTAEVEENLYQHNMEIINANSR